MSGLSHNLLRDIAFGVVILVLVGVIVLAITHTDQVTVTVKSFSWSRQITVQKYAWTNENSLTGFPPDSIYRSQKWEVVGYHTVTRYVPTQTCSGSGRYRSCKSSVSTRYDTVADYAWRYYYQIQEWVYARSLFARGSGAGRDPLWPTTVLVQNYQPERLGPRTETFTVTYTDHDRKDYPRQVNYDKWMVINPLIQYVLSIDLLGNITNVQEKG